MESGYPFLLSPTFRNTLSFTYITENYRWSREEKLFPLELHRVSQENTKRKSFLVGHSFIFQKHVSSFCLLYDSVYVHQKDNGIHDM